MSIHRVDHEAYSLFLASGALQRLLADAYKEPERTVVASEILHTIIGHRRRGEPYTLEGGVVRVADALDMAQGRTRLPLDLGHEGIHSISAAAVDEVRISAGEERPVRIEIQLNNSAGIFQVDDLLATKIRGTPLDGRVEVIAKVEGETEKRLLSGLPALLGRRVGRAVELGDQRLHLPVNLVAGLPHRIQRLALRVFEVPIEVALAGDVGALVAAAHRHHDVGPFGVLGG